MVATSNRILPQNLLFPFHLSHLSALATSLWPLHVMPGGPDFTVAWPKHQLPLQGTFVAPVFLL